MKKPTQPEAQQFTWGRLAAQVAIDILMVGAIMLAFAFFHHALPAIQAERLRKELLSATTPAPEPTTPVPATTAAPPESSLPGDTTPPPTEPDNRTPWQIQFEDHFTDEIVETENSYTSPNVSITIQTYTRGTGADLVTYHVADIYIASMENFATYTANGRMVYFDSQDVLEMDKASNAIIAISGDFFSYQKKGFIVRNGEIYDDSKPRFDICVLYPDGVMRTYGQDDYEVAQILAQNPMQVWQFGPALLDENGKAKKKFVSSVAVSANNPRSAIGYYEPGHYCFVVVDGRKDGYSDGLDIPKLAQLMEELGCAAAYNLDGGGSAVMTFADAKFSRQSSPTRKLGDILLIRESAE